MNQQAISTSSPSLLHNQSPSRISLYLPPVSDTHPTNLRGGGGSSNPNTFNEVQSLLKGIFSSLNLNLPPEEDI